MKNIKFGFGFERKKNGFGYSFKNSFGFSFKKMDVDLASKIVLVSILKNSFGFRL